jgi:hypothetical protein
VLQDHGGGENADFSSMPEHTQSFHLAGAPIGKEKMVEACFGENRDRICYLVCHLGNSV